MISVLKNLTKDLISTTNRIYTDSIVSRLHYQITLLALLFFSIIATSSNNLGKPIECTTGQKNVPADFIKTYCWIHPTFIVESNNNNQLTSTNEILPFYGLENSNEKSKTRIYNGFYQWVSIAFLVHAALLYIPRLLWKSREDSIIKNLLLENKFDFSNLELRSKASNHITAFIEKNPRMCANSSYYYFIFTEFMNLINIVVQIILINNFLNKSLLDYALNVLNHSNWSFETFFDPMTKTFPKMAKCKYYDYGASGSPNVIDYLCVLPYNIYFEKMYLLVFFWFGFLLIINIINLIYRILLSFSRELRIVITSKNLQHVNKTRLKEVINSFSIGKWFILNVLSYNVDPDLFEQILEDLNQKIEKPISKNAQENV